MRRVAVIVLGLMYVLVVMRPVLPRLLFSMNRAYIQSSLCMQRDDMANTCKGACFMRKNLQQQQQGSQELPSLPIEEIELCQLLPATTMATAATMAAAHRLQPARDQRGLDQHVADLPVPPPWSPLHRLA